VRERVPEDGTTFACPDELEVMRDSNPAPVEPREVEVSLVLVHGFAHCDRRHSKRDLVPFGAQHLRAVDAGRIAAPIGHHDSPTGRHRACQHLPCLCRSDPAHVEARLVGAGPGGHDHGVRLQPFDVLRGGTCPEPELDIARGEHPLVVLAEPPSYLGVSGRDAGKRHLAADLVASLEKQNLRAARS
jgi:hypothetical protein